MRDLPSAKTARVGVAEVQLDVTKNLGWLFREQPKDDYGIDAHVELIDGEVVVPRLLALQIKSGASWFREPTPGGWWFRPQDDHVRYWLSHVLPVVVILHDTESGKSYWQVVSLPTLVQSKRGSWKLLIPADQVLDESAVEPLRVAAAGDSYVLRIRELRLARPWMERLRAGERLVIDVEEWVNKTSGRGSIVLGVDAEDGKGPHALAHWDVHLGLSDYAEVIPRLFAWAQVDLHEETYEEADHEAYSAECSIRDEGGVFFTQDWSTWRSARVDGLRPYANQADEVDYWRFELRLNSLGHAFLEVDDFASFGNPLLSE